MQNHGAGAVLSARRYRCSIGAADLRDLSREACVPRVCPRKQVESRCVGRHIRAEASPYSALTTTPTAADPGDLLGNRCAGPTRHAHGGLRAMRQWTTPATRATKLKSSTGRCTGASRNHLPLGRRGISDMPPRRDVLRPSGWRASRQPYGTAPTGLASRLGERRYGLAWTGTRGVVGTCCSSAL